MFTNYEPPVSEAVLTHSRHQEKAPEPHALPDRKPGDHPRSSPGGEELCLSSTKMRTAANPLCRLVYPNLV